MDPVLLLDREEWYQIAEKEAKKQKYIFVYATHLNGTFKGFLQLLHKQTGLPIVYTVCGPKQALKLKMLQVHTPERWLQLLRDAEYVVTNSFHATAFSVLFHKKFFTVVHGQKDKGINVRMNDFLNAVGLGDRLFSSVPEKIDLEEIDYTQADQRTADMREKSLDFLRENLQAAYKEKLATEAKEA